MNKVLDKINHGREKVEFGFVISLWKDPTLFSDYENVSTQFLSDKDAMWYFDLGKAMYLNGYRTFDELSVETYLKDFPAIRKQYDQRGGYSEIAEMKQIVDTSNIGAYYDQIQKMNNLTMLFNKYNDLFANAGQFESLSSNDIYNIFENVNNSIALSNNEKPESLAVDSEFIKGLEAGDEMGFSYAKGAPLLNYITLGAAPGLYMIGGHSGTGKSSFAFANMVLALHESGVRVAIISNEMGIKTYKVLLLEHILTQDLNYWGLTRKQIRIGKYNEEQKAKIEEAANISREKYADIRFIRMYSNDSAKIIQQIKRLRSQFGIDVFLYDTFKSDDSATVNQAMWQTLLLDSRRLDSTCRKLGVCCITTYQLALHTTNVRYLDATCLSNAKQIKEVYETMIYMRPIWEDEFTDERYDIHPWKSVNKERKPIKLDKTKKYLLCFVDKTRSDDDKQILVYEWKPHFNVWTEIGFARVVNEHRNI